MKFLKIALLLILISCTATLETAEKEITMTTENEKLTDTSKKLSQLKFNNSVQTIENPLEIKILRRQLAKLKTVLNEKKQD